MFARYRCIGVARCEADSVNEIRSAAMAYFPMNRAVGAWNLFGRVRGALPHADIERAVGP